MTFCLADPPYPGRASYYPENTEVDHAALIAQLMVEFPDGWALATSADRLQEVLALCPPEVRISSWHRRPRPTYSKRPLSAWEPLIFYGGRELDLTDRQGISNALTDLSRSNAFPGAIVGMKTPAYAEWFFDQIGAQPGDTFVDLFPGSGAMQKAWDFYTGNPRA